MLGGQPGPTKQVMTCDASLRAHAARHLLGIPLVEAPPCLQAEPVRGDSEAGFRDSVPCRTMGVANESEGQRGLFRRERVKYPLRAAADAGKQLNSYPVHICKENTTEEVQKAAMAFQGVSRECWLYILRVSLTRGRNDTC